MGVYNLTELVLKEIGLVAVEHSDPAAAGYEKAGEFAGYLYGLLPGFLADDRLEIPDHHGVGVGPGNRPDYVKSVVYIRDPVPKGLVHRVLERLAARCHWHDFRSQELHPEDIGHLALYVVLTHVYFALEAEHGGNRCRCHAVLARAGFSYDPFLAHPLGKEYLAYGVVYLMRAGMAEVFPLEEYVCPAGFFREPLRVVQRGRPADILAEVVGKLLFEIRVFLPLEVRFLELHHGGHQS